MLATAKHVPGHGDTGTDSHLALPVITADWRRLDSVELVPFRSAIQAGVKVVMSAHIALPGVDPGPLRPGTVAPNVLTGILRDSLHFRGVIVTDAFQFVVAMAGSILLAVLAVDWVGGLGPLVEQSARHYGSAEAAFGVIPPTDQAWLPLSTLLVFLGVQWWAAWYPGAEPGGGGYVVQRILSAKDERHGLLATLWFNVAHYALRPWPWILVGFVGALRYPDLANPEEGYVRVMVDVLPSPFKGLMLAAFAAAYMSTISTHLNWGASYLVNDVYLRFIRPDAGPRAQIMASRVATGILMALSLVVMAFLTSVEAGWKLLLALGAGTGLVLILRWYWWRVNAWSEISAMAASLVTSVALQLAGLNLADTASVDYALTMLITVGVTTVVWLAVTLMTPPESEATLERFYRRVRPGGAGWRPVSERLGYGREPIPGGALSWVNWAAGVTAVYAAVFAVGAFLTGWAWRGALYGIVSIVAFSLIYRNLRADPTLDMSVAYAGMREPPSLTSHH